MTDSEIENCLAADYTKLRQLHQRLAATHDAMRPYLRGRTRRLEEGEALGSAPDIKRASQVEPAAGGWQADMELSGGPKLPVCPTRSEALAQEVAWLREHRLGLGGAA
jgi:hypothetical protein